MNSREKDVQAKQEGDIIDSKISHVGRPTSRQWTSFKNPRIVRVSSTFGGKDRHSKVCTIRGLRDRRIRLSVPTAIQLYDLQDRLGLSQPSKVVDWLLDATKHEIDKLPPLQMPGNFSQFLDPALVSRESIAGQARLSHFLDANSVNVTNRGIKTLHSSNEDVNFNDHVDGNDHSNLGIPNHWNPAQLGDKSKEEERESTPSEQENLENLGGHQTFFPLANQPFFSGFPNNSLPYNTYLHSEPYNLSLSQSGNNSFTSQNEISQNNHSLAFPSGSQLYFYPSMIPPHVNSNVENDQRQMSHLQLLSSNLHNVPQNSLTPTLHLMSPTMKKLPSSQDKDDSQLNDMVSEANRDSEN